MIIVTYIFTYLMGLGQWEEIEAERENTDWQAHPDEDVGVSLRKDESHVHMTQEQLFLMLFTH